MKRPEIMRPDQSVFDACLQKYGSLEMGLALLAQDNILIDDNGNLVRSETLNVETTQVPDKGVVSFYARNGLVPASMTLADGGDDLYLTDDVDNPLTDDQNNVLYEN